MAYFLGLDAGGTKTTCALAQDNTILARASSGTIKLMRASSQETEENIDALLQAVSANAGVPLDAISCTCVGLAGISVPRIANWVRQALHARVSGEILLAGDQEIALDAAFSGGPGVLVIAGTGSNLIARTSAGGLIHIGGWGPAVADEGSGNWIGKQAVRAIFDALDRDENTLLQEKIMEAWDLPDVGSLIDRANQSPGPDFSKLTPIVMECAQQQDRYASRVLQQAGEDLGLYALLASHRMLAAERVNPISDPAPGSHANRAQPLLEIAFSGSILRHVPQVRNAMCAKIRLELPDVCIREEAVDPVEGALWRARHASRVACS